MNIERYKFFRDTQVWPLANDFNYEQWLANFEKGRELKIAWRIMDYFTFIPDCYINLLLSAKTFFLI